MTPEQVSQLIGTYRYDQMTADESAIAREWIRRHAAEYDSVAFNVRLGEGVDPGPAYTDDVRRMAQLGSQKRADLVACVEYSCTIVEVKVRISLDAMGQVLAYKTLLTAENPGVTVDHLVVIGNAAAPDVPELFAAHGVETEIYSGVS
jgi:hypothetical protein